MILQSLRTLLLEDAGIVAEFGTRLYPMQLPDAPTYPAAVLMKISGRSEQDMAGGLDLEDARVQITVVGMDGYEATVRAAKLIKRRLHGYGPGRGLRPCGIQRAVCINDFDLPEVQSERAGPRLRERVLEFSVWNTEG